MVHIRCVNDEFRKILKNSILFFYSKNRYILSSVWVDQKNDFLASFFFGRRLPFFLFSAAAIMIEVPRKPGRRLLLLPPRILPPIVHRLTFIGARGSARIPGIFGGIRPFQVQQHPSKIYAVSGGALMWGRDSGIIETVGFFRFFERGDA